MLNIRDTQCVYIIVMYAHDHHTCEHVVIIQCDLSLNTPREPWTKKS